MAEVQEGLCFKKGRLSRRAESQGLSSMEGQKVEGGCVAETLAILILPVLSRVEAMPLVWRV